MIVTGSGLERFMACRASAVLPRVYTESSTYAERGTAVHAHLERLANGVELAASLALAPEEHRAACEAVDLPALREDLRLSPEVAFAYNPVTDTARVLGQSLERDYSSVTEDEIPLTMDVAGLAGGVGIVRDYKTGHGYVRRTSGNWQMRGGAIAVARAFDLDQVDAQLVFVRDGRPVARDRAGFDAFGLAEISAELHAAWLRAKADRLAHAAGEHIPATEGSWCRYCPSAWSCPAKIGLIKAALAADADQAIRPREVAALLVQVDAGMKALESVKTRIYNLASVEPLLCGVDGDDEIWLGKRRVEGNEKLDGRIAIEVAAEQLGVPADKLAAFQSEVSPLTATKASLTRAVSARVAHGRAGKTVDAILKEVRRRDGASRPVKTEVGLYTIRRPAPAADGQ